MKQGARLVQMFRPLADRVIPQKLDAAALMQYASLLGVKIDVLGWTNLAQTLSTVLEERRKSSDTVKVGDILNDPRVLAVVDAIDTPATAERANVRCPNCGTVMEVETSNPRPCIKCGFSQWTDSPR